MRADMDLGDCRPRMRDGYVLAARLFLAWGRTEPSARTEEHVRAYFLFLREQKERRLATAHSTSLSANRASS